MMMPQTRGATVVYNNILRPLLQKNKDKIERFIAEVKGGAASIASEAKKHAVE